MWDAVSKYYSGIQINYGSTKAIALRQDGYFWGHNSGDSPATSANDFKKQEVPDYNGDLTNMDCIIDLANGFQAPCLYPIPVT